MMLPAMIMRSFFEKFICSITSGGYYFDSGFGTKGIVKFEKIYRRGRRGKEIEVAESKIEKRKRLLSR